jgi:hypothetical protein
MNRNEMIEALIPAMTQAGEALAPARRRLWRMSTAALCRELLLRGVVEYEEPLPSDDADDADSDSFAPGSLLGWTGGPVYND